MTADPKEGHTSHAESEEQDEDGFVIATRELAAFARQRGLCRADTLLTELLAILYARKA